MMLTQHCSVSLGRGKGMTHLSMYFIYFIFSFRYVFHPAAEGHQDVGTWILLLNNLTSHLPEANLDLAYNVIMIKEFLPLKTMKLLWLCFYYWLDSLSLWRNFLLHVWQRLFRLLPFFPWQVCWSFWRSVKGCGRLVLNNTLPKILPYSSGSPAIAFYVLP